MDFIRVTEENIGREHICCAIAKEDDAQVASKKAWLKEAFRDGLVFIKSEERGKCFIEYIPGEYAWVPIIAGGYMYINCLWVSGKFKGHGHSNELLDYCIADAKAKGKRGLCILSSAKKRPFLADPGFLAHKGFAVCDEAPNGVQLWYLPFQDGERSPMLLPVAKMMRVTEPGYVVYHTHQCPYTAKYVPLLKEAAERLGVPFTEHLITCCGEAQRSPSAVTSFALFHDGAFVTNEIPSVAKFEKLVEGNR